MLTDVAPPRPSAADLSGRPHAVVIGSGFGGLAAAVRLGARGYRVTVLEQLDAPGGRAYVYRQDGFTFDAGPTIVTAPFLFEELWQLVRQAAGRRRRAAAGRRRSTASASTTARCFDYTGDPAAMRAEVARFSPGDVAGLRALHARRARRSSGSASSSWATCRSAPGPTWCGSLPDWSGCSGYRTRLRPGRRATSGTRGCGRCSASIRC